MAEGDEIVEDIAKASGINVLDMAIKAITGLLTVVIIILSHFIIEALTDISELRRDVDKHIENITPRVEANEEQLVNLWEMKNLEQAQAIVDLKAENDKIRTEGMWAMDLMGKVLVVESRQEFLLKQYDK